MMDGASLLLPGESPFPLGRKCSSKSVSPCPLCKDKWSKGGTALRSLLDPKHLLHAKPWPPANAPAMGVLGLPRACTQPQPREREWEGEVWAHGVPSGTCPDPAKTSAASPLPAFRSSGPSAACRERLRAGQGTWMLLASGALEGHLGQPRCLRACMERAGSLLACWPWCLSRRLARNVAGWRGAGRLSDRTGKDRN